MVGLTQFKVHLPPFALAGAVPARFCTTGFSIMGSSAESREPLGQVQWRKTRVL
jgi:hypothetical protein